MPINYADHLTFCFDEMINERFGQIINRLIFLRSKHLTDWLNIIRLNAVTIDGNWCCCSECGSEVILWKVKWGFRRKILTTIAKNTRLIDNSVTESEMNRYPRKTI
jgi:hypothetical protein